MSVQKKIQLQVSRPPKKTPTSLGVGADPEERAIHIQVAEGWAVSGYYQDNILQAVTLKKSAVREAK